MFEVFMVQYLVGRSDLEPLTFFFFQAEDGIRDRSPSRGLGDVYKRQFLLGETMTRMFKNWGR